MSLTPVPLEHTKKSSSSLGKFASWISGRKQSKSKPPSTNKQQQQQQQQQDKTLKAVEDPKRFVHF